MQPALRGSCEHLANCETLGRVASGEVLAIDMVDMAVYLCASGV